MKIKIYGTYGIKEKYEPILTKYGFSTEYIDDQYGCYTETYVNINTLEELLSLSKEISEVDGSEMIISNSYGLNLEIYNGYRE